MQSNFDTMPLFQRPAACSLPPSRKSKLRPTGVHSAPPPNQASFFFWSAKAAKTRWGECFQWRVMVKLAWVTERDILLSFDIVKPDDAVLERLEAGAFQFGFRRAL